MNKMNVSKFMNNFDPIAAHLRDHFGLGIHPEDVSKTHGFVPHNRSILPTGYNRPWALVPNRRPLDDTKTASNVTTAKDGTFQVCVDVHHFAPKEIHVKTMDNLIIIEGKHEERTDDHGFIERRFVRKYSLPAEYDTEHIVSSLSSDGVLTVKAPPPPSIMGGHRTLPLHHTGPAHLSIKDHHDSSTSHANGVKKD
jgi:HSP20 family molecular chaperone IbpA